MALYWFNIQTYKLAETETARYPDNSEYWRPVLENDYFSLKANEQYLVVDRNDQPISVPDYQYQGFSTWNKEKQEYEQSEEQRLAWIQQIKDNAAISIYGAIRQEITNYSDLDRDNYLFITQAFYRTLINEIKEYKLTNKLPEGSQLELFCKLNDVTLDDKIKEVEQYLAKANYCAQAIYYNSKVETEKFFAIEDVTKYEQTCVFWEEFYNKTGEQFIKVYDERLAQLKQEEQAKTKTKTTKKEK